jgi:predicted esterase YcpF (UPF0227 family)
MKNVKIVYFHGYGSNALTDKVTGLKAAGYDVVAPNIPVMFDDAVTYLDTFIRDLGDVDLLFVGTSLGGYWASMMGDKFIVPVVLINPSCSPSDTLKRYDNPDLTQSQLDKFKDLNPSVGLPRIVVLAKDDDVLDINVAANLFAGKAQVNFYQKGGHRFNDINTISLNITELLKHSYYLP